jgi:hypothetical protein
VSYRARKNIQRRGYCEVVPCDQRAVARSHGGVPVCLTHGYYLGGFNLAEGFESLGDFDPVPELGYKVVRVPDRRAANS